MQDSEFELVHQMLLLDADLACPLSNRAARPAAQEFASRLLSELGMEQLGPLQFFEATDPRAPGWSFIQPITTSHVSGHYFELPGETPRLHVDVYSCKSFDHTAALRAIHAQFRLTQWVGTLVTRTLDLAVRSTIELAGKGERISRQQEMSNKQTPSRTC